MRSIICLAIINMLLVLVLLNTAGSIFAKPLGMALNLFVTRQSQQLTIRINSENVIYVDNKVITFNELRRYLTQPHLKGGRIALEVDRRASAGRMMEVMELCRGLIEGQVYVVALD
jgi:biopolymer transport protein ExbD